MGIQEDMNGAAEIEKFEGQRNTEFGNGLSADGQIRSHQFRKLGKSFPTFRFGGQGCPNRVWCRHRTIELMKTDKHVYGIIRINDIRTGESISTDDFFNRRRIPALQQPAFQRTLLIDSAQVIDRVPKCTLPLFSFARYFYQFLTGSASSCSGESAISPFLIEMRCSCFIGLFVNKSRSSRCSEGPPFMQHVPQRLHSDKI